MEVDFVREGSGPLCAGTTIMLGIYLMCSIMYTWASGRTVLKGKYGHIRQITTTHAIYVMYIAALLALLKFAQTY